MDGWRGNISRIRELRTGEASEGWWKDLYALAEDDGYQPENWREAVHSIALRHGVEPSGWRSDLYGAASALGEGESRGWASDINYIREYLESNPAEANRHSLYDSLGQALYDSPGRRLYARKVG